tara:strand:- start:44 stop:1000 length:957 start_codon:yes stop_codon:yes gene_type:complete
MDNICPICGELSSTSEIEVRSGKIMVLSSCSSCEFDFFDKDPSEDLAADHLDESRLKSAGLDIPPVEKDFINGTKQSLTYIEEYFENSDNDKNILEIGCSWGYFLKLLKDKGANPYGIELNKNRATYVNNFLKISCFESLDECEKSGKKFHKVFLFYVLEYIPNPVNYFERLLNLLEEGGKIILITPNLNDFIKDGFQNLAFKRFFYDEHAINYFTEKAMRKFISALPSLKQKIFTKQNYSFINHLNWHLTSVPKTTGIVGGDNFLNEWSDKLNNELIFTSEIKQLMKDFDDTYRNILERNKYGNQIHLILEKEFLKA